VKICVVGMKSHYLLDGRNYRSESITDIRNRLLGGGASMKIAVTGAAGFIGSHLCERLLQEEQNEVVGIDNFINPSVRSIKERNIRSFFNHPRFHFYEQDLLNADWKKLLHEVDAIYHLVEMPGERSSWGTDFDACVSHNILVTQRLLEACKAVRIKKLIYASTSSVYGEKIGKVSEDSLPSPLSPYGVSKLAGEHLCKVYQQNDGIPIVILRYFTVYGPRQRADMAFHRFIQLMLQRKPIPIYGDGKQTRDFTYISDCVEATAAVLHADGVVGETINIGGLERASVLDAIVILENLLGKKSILKYIGEPRGEPKQTWADISKAQKLLHYQPTVSLASGLEKELNDLRELYKG
jgi:UDP-glucuronate 4-epimerase